MRHQNLYVLLFPLTLSMLVAGCGPTDESDPSEVTAQQSAIVQIQGGTSCVALLAGQTTVAGTVCSSIEGDNLNITYSTSGGWSLTEAHLWAGLSLAGMPQTKTGNPKIGNFPYVSGPLADLTSWSVLVPLSTFGLSSSMTVCDPRTGYVVAHAAVRRTLADGSVDSQTAYGEGTRLVAKGNWATWFSLTLTCTDDKPTPESCETAFARSSTASACFINSPYIDTNRWGWTNGPIGPGSYTMDIWAAAGRCDLSKGTRVGTLNVSYDGATATVSYQMSTGFTLDETHLYVGSEPLARDVNGEYTVAPGQYGRIHDLTKASSDSFTVTGLSGPIYVVAHAVACAAVWP